MLRQSVCQYAKNVIWIILVLAGYKIAGQILLSIYWGPLVLSEFGAFLLSMGRKMMQLIYVLLIFWACGWMRDMKWNRADFCKGIKIACPLLVLYGILFGLAMMQAAGVISIAGTGKELTWQFVCEQFLYFFLGTALTEELFFRGILMRKLAFLNELTRRWNLAFLAQAFLFGIMHGWQLIQAANYAGAFCSMAWAAVGGLVYGLVYRKSNSIWAAVFLHGCYDFSVILLLH